MDRWKRKLSDEGEGETTSGATSEEVATGRDAIGAEETGRELDSPDALTGYEERSRGRRRGDGGSPRTTGATEEGLINPF